MPRKVAFDADNPEWTAEDFKRAEPAALLPTEIRKAFPNTRGAQKTPRKVPVSIRLTSEVVERFKASGPGWQSRIDDVLKKAVGL
jgi:uncharacterized protein (DUF4415 family)